MSNSIDLFKQAIGSLFWGARSRRRPQLAPLTWEEIGADKVRELKVMVSSPKASLESIRTLLRDWLLILPNVGIELFEFIARGGVGPHQASVDMIDRADVVVLLFGDKTGSSSGGPDETFSQLEFKALKERQGRPESFGRPRVFVYKHTTRALDPWELEAAADYGLLEMLDEQMLATQIFVDVSAALLAERQLQAKTLFDLKGILTTERSTAAAERQRHEATLEEVESSFKAEVATLNGLRDSLRRQVEENQKHDDTREARVTAAYDARSLAERRLLAVGAIGLAIGLLAAILAFKTAWRPGVPSDGATAAVGAKIVQGLGTIAERIAARPASIDAKIELARMMNSKFDCAVGDVADWPVTGVPEARFSRAEVCESWGSLVLRIGRVAKNCEVTILSNDDARALARILDAGRSRIRLARIIGRSSVDHIDRSCRELPPGLAPEASMQMADRKIRTNTQLGWARAAYARRQLEAAMEPLHRSGPDPIALETSIGVLDRRSGVSGPTEDRDRGVDIEIYATGDNASRKAMTLR